MARPRERDTVCTDLELVRELRARFTSLRVFAEVSGLSYPVVTRVINGHPVTEQELGAVRLAWAKFSPEGMYDAAERVFQELDEGRIPHRADVVRLRKVVHRLIGVVSKGGGG